MQYEESEEIDFYTPLPKRPTEDQPSNEDSDFTMIERLPDHDYF